MCTTRCPKVFCCGVGRKLNLSAGISSTASKVSFDSVATNFRNPFETGFASGCAVCVASAAGACRAGVVNGTNPSARIASQTRFIDSPPVDFVRPKDSPRDVDAQANPFCCATQFGVACGLNVYFAIQST